MVTYDKTFFDYIQQGASKSADAVTSRVFRLLPVTSVLDIGCGRGTWLAQWKTLGVTDILGVDGSYVSAESLVIPPANFRAADLCRPLELGRRFDLVQSLEVAEHLPAAAADTLVSTLTRHGDIVLFSAARPGQGGESHLNEQPYRVLATAISPVRLRNVRRCAATHQRAQCGTLVSVQHVSVRFQEGGLDVAGCRLRDADRGPRCCG